MVKWTKAQQEAIDRSGSNLLVAAAAGSGKTAVLVERIIQKVMDKTDPIDIDEILVATFTNAAAEEMRNRIGLALEDAIAADAASYHLKKQLSLLQKAQISTLHAFCTTIVRQYAYLLDIDPAFRIADGMEIDIIRGEIMDEVLEAAYSRDREEDLDSFYKVIDMFSSDRSDVDVGRLILELYDFAVQHPWPESWLHDVAEAYHVEERTEESDLIWLNLLKRDLHDDFVAFQTAIEQAILLAREADGPYHYLEALEADLQLIQTAIDKLDDWNGLQAWINENKLKSLSRKKIECNEDKKEQVKKIREPFRKGWNDMKKSLFSRNLTSHLEDMAKLYPAIKEITSLVISFKTRFTKVKREQALVDFSDLEHFCLEILLGPASTREKPVPSHVAKTYQQQFKEILVDEYQDINLVQEMILSSVADQDGKGNMFMVGDVKQSIYRFRHAEPTLFIQKYKQFKQDETKGYRIDLAKNFRSREGILSGANFIFRQLFDEGLGEIAYDKDAELIYGNYSYEDFPMKGKATELIIIDRDNETGDKHTETDEDVQDLLHTQLEARVYAEKIKEWIGSSSGTPSQVIDKKSSQKRAIQYRDIVILKRSLTDVAIIMDEFKKQGIPVYAEQRTGYFQAIEIQVMVNMLKIIDNPFQDIPLASVLRSPIVGLNEEDLAHIRLANRHGAFYDALRDYVKQVHRPELTRFLTQLARFRKLAKEGALSELIWVIFQETAYYDFVGGIPGGRQRQANLRALYDRARTYEATSFRGLFRFLRFVERMQEEKKDLGEARALSEQEDVVRIMTIHKSKGLEFPVVIIGGMNKQFNFSDLRTNFMLDKDHGFATQFIDPVKRITYPTLYYTAVKSAALQKLLAEEMRVLYVAMTRAKEKLVMIGHVPQAEKSIAKWETVLDHEGWVLPTQLRKKAKTFLDWVGPALIRHKYNDILRSESTQITTWQEVEQDPSEWNVHFIGADQLADIENETAQVKNELQEQIVNWEASTLQDHGHYGLVDHILAYQYPFKEATTTRAKQSVTEIKRRREVTDAFSDKRLVKPFRAPLVKRPRFMQEETALSSAEIGTAMHVVMQHIDFEKDGSSRKLQSLLNRLVTEEKLTGKEAVVIDIQAIEQFLLTELARKIKSGSKIAREVPFTYMLDAPEVYQGYQGLEKEKVLIQGVIDCLVHTNDGLIIVDYKTDKIKDRSVTDETIRTLADRYRVQLGLYKVAIEHIMQKKVKETYLYFFDQHLQLKME